MSIKYLRLILTKKVKEIFDKNVSLCRKKLKRIPENGKISIALRLLGTT